MLVWDHLECTWQSTIDAGEYDKNAWSQVSGPFDCCVIMPNQGDLYLTHNMRMYTHTHTHTTLRHIELNMPQVCMELETSFMEARAWFPNTHKPLKHVSNCPFCSGNTSKLRGEDPAVGMARL